MSGNAKPIYGGEAAQLNGASPVRFGRFTMYAVWRVASDLAGVTLHIYGPRTGVEEEVLRFDCFDAPPHYHLGWSYLDTPYVVIEAADPLAWSFAKLTDFDELLSAAKADALTPEERAALPDAIEALRHNAAAL